MPTGRAQCRGQGGQTDGQETKGGSPVRRERYSAEERQGGSDKQHVPPGLGLAAGAEGKKDLKEKDPRAERHAGFGSDFRQACCCCCCC